MDESPNNYAKYKGQKRFLDDSIYKTVWRRQKKLKKKKKDNFRKRNRSNHECPGAGEVGGD